MDARYGRPAGSGAQASAGASPTACRAIWRPRAAAKGAPAPPVLGAAGSHGTSAGIG